MCGLSVGQLELPKLTDGLKDRPATRLGAIGDSTSSRATPQPIFALTSLSPAPARVPIQRECIRSWRHAGLHVYSFNHPSEIAELASLYDVAWVPASETSANVFGRHYIPIKTALNWAAKCDAPALLINADIELRLKPWEMRRLRWLSEGGVCYFVRFNHDGSQARASREPHGIDAFLLHGRDTGLVPDSFLSIGQPFWDYLLPYLFSSNGRLVTSVEFPTMFHRIHPQQWSWESWRCCALEFLRATGAPAENKSFNDCVEMSLRVRQSFERTRLAISPQPRPIREWVQSMFQNRAPKTFFELGSHCGTDTDWLAGIPGVTIHAFEPDPRNHQRTRSNVTQHRAAISDCDGRAAFILSAEGWGQIWTHSSSLKKPKNHLQRYPVTFGETIEVETVTLDTFCRREGITGVIDFIWADIQGAEGELVRGGRETLARTRYFYTEYSDDEMYEGQSALQEIMAMLPDFRAIELWPDDVLLQNQRLSK